MTVDRRVSREQDFLCADAACASSSKYPLLQRSLPLQANSAPYLSVALGIWAFCKLHASLRPQLQIAPVGAVWCARFDRDFLHWAPGLLKSS